MVVVTRTTAVKWCWRLGKRGSVTGDDPLRVAALSAPPPAVLHPHSALHPTAAAPVRVAVALAPLSTDRRGLRSSITQLIAAPSHSLHSPPWPSQRCCSRR